MKNPSYSKLLVVLTALLVLAWPRSGWAQFNFITNADNTITITGYTGPGGNVTITNMINGYKVTAIGTNAFSNITTLMSVTIPNSITSIGDYAFFYCPGLTSFTIPASVTSIGKGALDCGGLTNIDVAATNPSYVSAGGVLFNITMTRLVQYPAGLPVGTYAIPNSVTSIGDYAFDSCYSLTSVTIPDGVTNVATYAFWGCSGLTSVTIPDSVISLGEGAFDACGLTSVTIGNSVISIGDYAFVYCSGLTSVTIPDSVTSIGKGAFYLTGLTSVTIGNSVISIGDYAFVYCSGLTSVTIPYSVTNVGDDPFGGCSSLTNIDVAATNSSYASAGGVLFNITLTTLIQYPGGLAGSYAIPNSITSIGLDAFDGCSGLTSVTIPDGVTSIGGGAFQGCSGLTSVTIPDSVTSIGQYAFRSCTSLHQAYFQGNAPSVNGGAGSADTTVFNGESGTVYYVPGTTGWGAYFGGWPTAGWYQPQPQILSSGYGLGMGSQGFQFTISWATNAAVVVEASTNLQDWTPVSTNTLVSGTNLFWDPDWTHYPQRFYRVDLEQ